MAFTRKHLIAEKDLRKLWNDFWNDVLAEKENTNNIKKIYRENIKGHHHMT